jgi:NADP-dependent 3-hydroxy acid dehydrogenase YdfG
MMKHRSSFALARCLVTGASSNFGRAMTRQLAHDGARIILNGRSLTGLEKILRNFNREGINTDSLILVDADLTEPEGRNKLIHAVNRQFGTLDLVVNAARMSLKGRTEIEEIATLRSQFEINFFGLIELTNALMPMFQGGEAPAIINLGSTLNRKTRRVASDPDPSLAAVAAYSESIRQACSKQGIHLLTVDPIDPRSPQDRPRTWQAKP